jgi:MFS transporter, ACS family, tartrate transporter
MSKREQESDTKDFTAIEKSVVKKIMNRLIPFLAILYVFCLLDRGNVSIAALTMQKDLNFSDKVYGLGAGIFFIGYFIFEVPSNLIMEKVGARRWIARIMITWGLISAGMMFVKTPVSFYTMRFLLGLAEAGFYPGVLLYLTYWVPASIRARVLSRFFALTTVLGLFGGPLGGVLLKLDGWHGLEGWQWLFLLEGIPSVLLSVWVLRSLHDSPNQATWLTDAEKSWLANRLERDASEQPRIQHLTWRKALTEPRILYLCLIFILTSTAGNAIGFFGPQLLKERSGGLWSDSFISNIGTIPGIVGAIAILLAAQHSDRTGKRRQHVFTGYAIAGLGFALCVFLPTAPGIICALCLTALGERIAAGSYWAVTTNLLGGTAAAGGLAFINSIGNLGGFIGPLLMGELKTRNNGAFAPGLYTAAGLMLCAACFAFFMLKQQSPMITNTAARDKDPDSH